MPIAPVAAGNFIAYLVEDDGEACKYIRLRVLAVEIDADGKIEPIIALPDGNMLRATEFPARRAFAVGPGECFEKLAAVHAAQLGRNARAAA